VIAVTTPRTAGPFSTPNLLQRATPFIGAAVLASALPQDSGLTHLTLTHGAALVMSVFLILSPVWPKQLQSLPRLAKPLPATLALALSGLPIAGSPASNPGAYVALAVSIAIPFTMDAIPWGRLPRWGESVALLGMVSLMLLGRPQNDTADMLAFPIANIVVLFIALYGSRTELVLGVGIIALHFGLPNAGEPVYLAEFVRDGVIVCLTAVVAVSVFQVVTVMRRQQATIVEDERQARVREEWIHSILENTTEALVTVDVWGLVLSMNRAAREMFGYDLTEMAGRPLNVLVADAGQEEFDQYLVNRMRHFATADAGMRETVCIGKDMSEFSVEYSAGETEDAGARVFIITLRDVTARKAQSDLLEHQALHDGLTGLPNRVLLEDRLEQGLATAKRNGQGMAVMMLDFNRFKQVNDQLGHEVGDQLLREISARLAGTLRASDTIARLGGDEFVVLPAGVQSVDQAVEVANKILDATAQPVTINGHRIAAGISIGIALYPGHGSDAESLLHEADQAMYLVKRSKSGYGLPAPEASEITYAA
jgi:diguanylate cyclase (GGDEF)-like protein/PAS domain S-box-containing protein